MTGASIQSVLGVSAGPRGSLAPRRGEPSFEARLNEAGKGAAVDQARRTVQQFVGVAFVQPMLAHLRTTTRAAGPFAPGDAERRFGPLLDQHLADRITASPNFPLVNRLEEHILGVMAKRLESGEYAPVEDQVNVVV